MAARPAVPVAGLPSLSFPSWMTARDIVWEVLSYRMAAAGLTLDDLDAAIANRTRTDISEALRTLRTTKTVRTCHGLRGGASRWIRVGSQSP